jgi:formylglycine-generating enzyme required for sulfatase activity
VVTPPETLPVPAHGAGIGSFFMGKTAVTNGQYAPFLAGGAVPAPPWWADPDFSGSGRPVVGVSFDDCVAYCEWLSEATGSDWRLPMEAEWEHAACGGLAAPRTAWGEAVPPGEIPEGALRGPWEAGRGTPNGYGLCDMGTIVHEWCLDWREPARPGAPRRRASRGGSWRHAVRWSAPAASSSLPPERRYADYGFRILRTR